MQESNIQRRFHIAGIEEKHKRKVKENESLTEKLGRKIPPLIEKLPPKSPFRQGLIQHFAKDEDVNKVSGFLSTSPQTVKMANQTSTSPLFEIKYKPNTRREKTPKEHIKIIEDFWHDHTYPLPWKKTIKYKGKRSKKKSRLNFLTFLSMTLIRQ